MSKARQDYDAGRRTEVLTLGAGWWLAGDDGPDERCRAVSINVEAIDYTGVFERRLGSDRSLPFITVIALRSGVSFEGYHETVGAATGALIALLDESIKENAKANAEAT